jgi:hypothetical protein
MGLIAQAAASSPAGPIAAGLFVVGLGCVFASIALLLGAVSTIPIRWRVYVGDDRVLYLRIFGAHPGFVAALDNDPAPTACDPALPLPQALGADLSAPGPGRLDRRLRLGSYGVAYGLALMMFLVLVLVHAIVLDLPIVILLLVLLSAICVVAAASRWHVHLGKVFTLGPANAVAIVGCAAVAGAAGLISALGAQPDTASVQLAASLGAAGAVIVVAVVGQIIWHLVRPR